MSRDDLFKAIDVADEAKLRELLVKDSTLAASRSADGVSAILFTLYLAKYDLTKALLEHEPELDLFDLAALNMHEKMSEVLGNITDINQLSGDGFSALHLACFFGSLESASLLIDNEANVNIHATNMTDMRPIHSACAAGQAALAGLLLKAGAKPNVIQSGGYTPLMAAASLGNASVVDMLLEYGADRAVKSDDNKIAADFAKAAGFKGLVEKLTLK